MRFPKIPFWNRALLLKMLLWLSDFRDVTLARALTAKDFSRRRLEMKSGKLKSCRMGFAPLPCWHPAALPGGTTQGKPATLTATGPQNHGRQTAHTESVTLPAGTAHLEWLWDSEMPTRAKNYSFIYKITLHRWTISMHWEPPLH